MRRTISALIKKLASGSLVPDTIIPWSSPVPSFGDPGSATIATVGLNPSNREFVDEIGNELTRAARRFPTLNSLRLRAWSEATEDHLDAVEQSCRHYFNGNPYDLWFKRLDRLLSPSAATFYGLTANACH